MAMQVEAATGSVVRSWSYPPPWGASHSGQHPNGAQQKARRLVGAPVEKVRLELVPRTAAAKEALEAKGLHPYQAKTMRATKRVCSILLHLSRTWGQEGLVLRPDPRRCTPLLKGMAWSVESVDSHLQVLEIFQGLGCPDRFQLTYDLLSPSTAPCQALENTPSPPGSGHTSELASVTPLSGACGSPPPEADIQSRAQPLPPPSAEEAVKSSRPPLSPQSKAAPPSLPTAPRIPGPADSCDAFNKFLQGCPTPEGSGLINEKEEGGAEERGGVASLFRQEFSRQLGAAAPDATRSEDDGGGSQGSSDHTAAPGSLGGCRKRNVVPLADLGIARGGGEREGKRGKRVGEDKGGGSAPWETSLDAWRLASGSLPQPDTGGGWQALMISGDSNILCDMLCRPKSQHGEDTEARDLEDFGGNVGGQSLGFSIGIDTLLGVDDAGGDGQEGIAAPGGPSGRPPPLGSSRQGSGESGGGGNAGLSVRPFQELFKAS